MSNASTNVPASYGVLKPETKLKAIEIARQLISKGFEEGVSYTVGMLCANKPGEEEGRKVSYHLLPHQNGWGLIKESADEVCFTEADKAFAMDKARCMAKASKVKLFIHANSCVRDVESFEVNFPVMRPTVKLGQEAMIEITRSKVLINGRYKEQAK